MVIGIRILVGFTALWLWRYLNRGGAPTSYLKGRSHMADSMRSYNGQRHMTHARLRQCLEEKERGRQSNSKAERATHTMRLNSPDATSVTCL